MAKLYQYTLSLTNNEENPYTYIPPDDYLEPFLDIEENSDNKCFSLIKWLKVLLRKSDLRSSRC